MQQFQRQQQVNFGGVVLVPLKVTVHHGFDRFPFEERPGKGFRVKQHLPNVRGEHIPIPNAVMSKLVPTQKEAFEVQP